jgi:hypothetical protein
MNFTLGQDESITGGHLQGIVARFDGFYPLPLSTTHDGRWNFLYLFGTTTFRLAKGINRTPLVLQGVVASTGATGVTGAVSPYGNNVWIVSTPATQDTYRIGFGVDLVNFFRSIIP